MFGTWGYSAAHSPSPRASPRRGGRILASRSANRRSSGLPRRAAGRSLPSGETLGVRGNVTTPRCPRIDIAREPFSLTLWHRILPAFRCQRLRAEGNAFDFVPARPTLRRSLTQPEHADGRRYQECLKDGQVSGL